MPKILEKAFNFFFSNKFRHAFEKLILRLSLLGFTIHLVLIYLVRFNIVHPPASAEALLRDPISAIYTPFSFILVYEVFMLVYFLPSSFTIAVGKQYEIISLIVIRRIFKDITEVELVQNWFGEKKNVHFTVDLIGILILFVLIYFFYRLRRMRPDLPKPENLEKFVNYKKIVALAAIPILAFLSIYSLRKYIVEHWQFNLGLGDLEDLSNINNIFYNEFFGVLILLDVFILILSLNYTENYSQLIRNSGFVISTIIIRLSFSAPGTVNTILVLAAVLFGVLILGGYNLVGRQEALDQDIVAREPPLTESSPRRAL